MSPLLSRSVLELLFVAGLFLMILNATCWLYRSNRKTAWLWNFPQFLICAFVVALQWWLLR